MVTSGCFPKSTSGRSSHFCSIILVCKKQGAVSHSTSEAEIISLDAGVRMEGMPMLFLWEEVLEVFGTGCKITRMEIPKVLEPSVYEILQEVDFVPPSFKLSTGNAKCVVFEDNDAVIKMTIKERAPMLRHVARMHRVDLDWLFERLKTDPGLSIKFIGTKEQMADMFTKGTHSPEPTG